MNTPSFRAVLIIAGVLLASAAAAQPCSECGSKLIECLNAITPEINRSIRDHGTLAQRQRACTSARDQCNKTCTDDTPKFGPSEVKANPPATKAPSPVKSDAPRVTSPSPVRSETPKTASPPTVRSETPGVSAPSPINPTPPKTPTPSVR